MAERIRERVGTEALSSDAKMVTVTISIGVSAFPEHGENPETLIASADGALYHAKRSGRNRVVLASSHLQPGIEVAK